MDLCIHYKNGTCHVFSQIGMGDKTSEDYLRMLADLIHSGKVLKLRNKILITSEISYVELVQES